MNKIFDHRAKESAPEARPCSFSALFLRDAHDAGQPSYEIQGAAGHSSADMTFRANRRKKQP